MKKYQSGSAHLVIIICLALALAMALSWIFWQNFISNDRANYKEPTNFAECAAEKDSKSQPTYPEACVTKNGKRFVNPDQPSNYEECLEAPGSRIQESYPTVCVAKDGPSFTNPDQKLETEN